MVVDNLLLTDRDKIIAKHGKTREDVEKDIDTIVEWFKTQKHLPVVMNRNGIERCLVNTKFSIERTKQLCDMYYSCRKLLPQVFENSNPKLPDMNLYFDTVIDVPLPKLTKDLYRVCIVQFTDFEHPHYNPNKLLAHMMNIFEILLLEEMNMGEIIIVDLKNVKLSYVLTCTPVHIKTSDFFMRHVWASPVKALHFVNIPPFADVLITIVKGIMKKKVLERTHFHTSAESLLKHVEKEVLPKDYGGEERSLEELNDLWRKKMASYQDVYDKLEKLEVNESLRAAPLENSEILGYYGNFKKLSVD